MKVHFTTLLLLTFFYLSFSKHHESQVMLRSLQRQPFRYITKFSTLSDSKGGSYQIKTKLNRHFPEYNKSKSGPEVLLSLYTDDKWDSIMKISDCQQRTDLADYNFPLKVSPDGSWSPINTGDFNKNGQNYVWYFVLSDCEHKLATNDTYLRLEWEMEIFNYNGSHLDETRSGLIALLSITLLSIAAFFFFNSVKLYKFYRSEESMDYPTLMLMMSLSLEFMSVTFELIHLQMYSFDGEGSFFFSFANRACSLMSQLIVLALLLLIAKGWSINTLKIDETDPLIYIYLFTGVMQVLILGIGTVSDDVASRHHDYEDWSGYVIFGIRIMLFLTWMCLFGKTYTKTSGDKQVFFKNFGLLSTVYFLAFPGLIAISSCFLAPYLRHKIVYGGTLVVQIAISIILTKLFNDKTTQYYKVSLKGKCLLPSNKFD